MAGPGTLKARLRATGPGPLIIAHRGVWGPLPENSLAAIAAARAYDSVEIDVQVAADGGLVVHHDASLGRMTEQARPLNAMTAEEICSLRLRQGAGGDGAAFYEECIPDLETALAAGDGLIFDLDAKNADETRAIAMAAADLGAAPYAAVKVDVASADDVAALIDLEHEVGLMVAAKVKLLDEGSVELIAALSNADVALAEVWFDDLAVLRAAALAGGGRTRLSTYTLDPVHCRDFNDTRALENPSAVWGKLIDAGIGALMTDQPAALRAFIVDKIRPT